jgi:hypothetical protein
MRLERTDQPALSASLAHLRLGILTSFRLLTATNWGRATDRAGPLRSPALVCLAMILLALSTGQVRADFGFDVGGLLPTANNASANWRMAGMQSVGGIPNRTTVCATLSPLGGGKDDSTQINDAINSCPAGEVGSPLERHQCRSANSRRRRAIRARAMSTQRPTGPAIRATRACWRSALLVWRQAGTPPRRCY